MEFAYANKVKRIFTRDEPEGTLRRQRGTFLLREHVLEDYPVLAQAIFSKFVPVQTQQWFPSQSMQFWGYSEDFEHVPEGQLVPEYDVLFHQDLMGRITVKFERVSPENAKGTRVVSFY
jgi:hypothetical protein